MRKLIGLAARARSGKDTVAKMIAQRANVVCYAFADPVKVGCQVLFGLTDAETWDDQVKEDKIATWNKSPREFFQLIGTEWMRNRDPDHWLLRAERAMNNAPQISEADVTPLLSDPKAPYKLASQAFFGLSAHQTWDLSKLHEVDSFWQLSPNQIFDFVEALAKQSFADFYVRRATRPVLLPTREIPTIDTRSIVVIKDVRYENEASFVRKHGGRIWHLVRDNAQKVNAHSSELGIKIKDNDVVINNNGTLQQLTDAVRAQWEQLC